jgi:MOSC domain-containing protein YiiM
VVNELNQVEFPMLGPGTFPCLGAYATVLADGMIRRGDQVVLE